MHFPMHLCLAFCFTDIVTIYGNEHIVIVLSKPPSTLEKLSAQGTHTQRQDPGHRHTIHKPCFSTTKFKFE